MPKVKKRIFSVELTNRCNFRCKFCPHSIYGIEGDAGNIFDRPKGIMSDELFDLVLENTNRYASSILLVFFGEQLLHPKFEYFIEKLTTKTRCPVSLNTNWSLVTNNHFPLLSKIGVVKISLDSIDPITYDKLCAGGGVLTLDGAKADQRCEVIVDKIKAWLHFKERGSTQIIFVTSSVNESQAGDFVKFWKPYLRKTDSVAIKSVISYGGVMKDEYMTNNPCKLHKGGKVNIAWNGDVSPCNLDVNMGLKSGNLLDVKDLSKIFNSQEWKDSLTNIRQHSGICKNCFDANNRKFRKIHRGCH